MKQRDPLKQDLQQALANRPQDPSLAERAEAFEAEMQEIVDQVPDGLLSPSRAHTLGRQAVAARVLEWLRGVDK